jgi:hypothetical protein
MKRSAAFFPIALAAAAITLVPLTGAQAQDFREEGPIEIEKCQTVDKPGSYKLVKNLTFTGPPGICLNITASSVTIDLAGFTISGITMSSAILAGSETTGIAVRNGSISGFGFGVGLGGDGSTVEGLRVFGVGFSFGGVSARGIVRGNTVVGINGGPGQGTGIAATGIVTGNYVASARVANYEIGQGSTVIGNTSVGIPGFKVGFLVSCPSNVTDNTAINSPGGNIVLNGTGCNNTNNVAP